MVSLVTLRGDGSPFLSLSSSGQAYNVSRRDPFSICDEKVLSVSISQGEKQNTRDTTVSATNLHHTMSVGMVMDSASLSRAPDENQLFPDC